MSLKRSILISNLCTLLASFLISGSIHAQETNGCGSGLERYVVPDRLKIIGCDFKASCNQHDVCYGACSSDPKGAKSPQCEYLRCQGKGDLVGSQECDSVKFRRLRVVADERRATCDANFMVDIVKNNPSNSRCTLFSALYPFAVRVLGSRAFVGAGATENAWSESEKDAYAKAINDLYANWSESQIKKFDDSLRKGEVKVDLTKKISFDNVRGLVNVP